MVADKPLFSRRLILFATFDTFYGFRGGVFILNIAQLGGTAALREFRGGLVDEKFR